MKSILAVSGSTRHQSTNLTILHLLAAQHLTDYEINFYEGLAELPHFNPDLDSDNPPPAVAEWRELITEADGVIICTPEYVFSLPGTLKNALDWTVSTVVFSDKPTALITAAMSGAKAHEQLQLVMQTIGAYTPPRIQLLIQGAKGKFNAEHELIDEITAENLANLAQSFKAILTTQVSV